MNSRSLPKKKRARHGFPYQMELNLYIEDANQAFVARINRRKCFLAARGSYCLWTMELISVLLDKMKQTGAVPERVDIQSDKSPMLENSGLCMSVAFISFCLRHYFLFRNIHWQH